jgi:hypothetical protein
VTQFAARSSFSAVDNGFELVRQEVQAVLNNSANQVARKSILLVRHKLIFTAWFKALRERWLS